MKSIIQWLSILPALLASTLAQAQFTYSTNGGVISVTGYSGAGGAVAISNFVNNIGPGAFENRSSITSITIPISVTNCKRRSKTVAGSRM
jgi:hypothetical protein